MWLKHVLHILLTIESIIFHNRIYKLKKLTKSSRKRCCPVWIWHASSSSLLRESWSTTHQNQNRRGWKLKLRESATSRTLPLPHSYTQNSFIGVIIFRYKDIDFAVEASNPISRQPGLLSGGFINQCSAEAPSPWASRKGGPGGEPSDSRFKKFKRVPLSR